jgi:hypothetical protein
VRSTRAWNAVPSAYSLLARSHIGRPLRRGGSWLHSSLFCSTCGG